MTNLVLIKPRTLDGIKSLAKKIKKAEGVPHHEALDKAAKQASFENFRHASRTLGRDPTTARSP